jgi:hypothetical protein
MDEARCGPAAAAGSPAGQRAVRRNAFVLRAIDWLSCAATPTFAIMAVLAGALGSGSMEAHSGLRDTTVALQPFQPRDLGRDRIGLDVQVRTGRMVDPLEDDLHVAGPGGELDEGTGVVDLRGQRATQRGAPESRRGEQVFRPAIDHYIPEPALVPPGFPV